MTGAWRIAAICLLSGAAALIFETVWFHRSGLVFGSSVWSTTLVLSSFMGGLTVGGALVAAWGHRMRQFLHTYAAAEAVVAISGVALTFALPGLVNAAAMLTRSTGEQLWMVNAVRFIAAFGVLIVPSTAMGATLPLLVAALARSRGGFGPALGWAYGWNTLGAVGGVIGAELWLIGRFGVAGSAWCAALLSLTAVGLALRLPLTAGEPLDRDAAVVRMSRRSPRGTRVETAPALVRTRSLLACSFLSGAALLALEVVWFRFLTMYVLSTTLAASLMLAVVLAGIGIGGLIASAWLKRFPDASTHLPAVAFVGGASVAASYASFRVLTEGVQIAAWYRVLWLAGALTFPASLASGILFTLVGDALQRGMRVETRTAGWVVLANTAGAMCGPLVAAFLLLPALGIERAFFALTAAYAAIGILAASGLGAWRPQLRSPAHVLGGAALAVALALFPFGLMTRVYFARVVAPYAGDGSGIIAAREGPSETILLMQQKWLGEPVYTRLVTNGFSMSGTAVPAMRYMRYFVYWPLAVHRGPIRNVLVICYGVGVTAGAARDLPSVEAIDVVEISRDVVAMSDTMYAPADHPLRDPRVRLHIEDGRQFLQTTAARFDLITGEPPPPRTPGAVNIYTREYFRLIHDRLADGGIATYWLPVGRPDPGTNVSAIIRAFCDVFEDCSLWNATPFDLMLAGMRGVAGPAAEEDFVRPWTTPLLRTRLSEVALELPQQVGATFLGDSTYLRELTEGVLPLVDDYPQRLIPSPDRLSLSDPGYGTDPFITGLYQGVLDPGRARQAFETSELIRRLWPERLVGATLPYFDDQRVINAVLWEGGRPLPRIEDLHRLLTTTPLRTLPLWLLSSDVVTERIAARHDDPAGASMYARGLSALATRDYLGAALAFAEAERRGLSGETLRPLRVYALCLAGRLEEARDLARNARLDAADQRHFWEWVGTNFGIGPFSRR